LTEELATGRSLRRVARAHGVTVAELRRAVLSALRAEVTRTIR